MLAQTCTATIMGHFGLKVLELHPWDRQHKRSSRHSRRETSMRPKLCTWRALLTCHKDASLPCAAVLTKTKANDAKALTQHVSVAGRGSSYALECSVHMPQKSTPPESSPSRLRDISNKTRCQQAAAPGMAVYAGRYDVSDQQSNSHWRQPSALLKLVTAVDAHYIYVTHTRY